MINSDYDFLLLEHCSLVILAEKYKGENIFNFIDDCKTLPEFNFNLPVEMLPLDRYRSDLRYSLGLLPKIDEKYAPDTPLQLYFNSSYNANSLDVQSRKIEKTNKYNEKDVDDRLQHLYSTLRLYWPYTYMKLVPHGSFITGLGFKKSFFNVCVEMDEPDMEIFADKSLSDIYTCRYPANINSVLRVHNSNHARKDFGTDLIQLKLGEVLFEIDFNKEITTESTYLILEYMKLDPRVKPFLNIIKTWGRDKSIFAPQCIRGMRFYSYTIMALAYLSQLDPPVIPNLQHINCSSEKDICYDEECRSKFNYWDVVYHNGEKVGIAARYHNCVKYRDPQTLEAYWNSSNTCGVGELFLDFLYYYGYIFNYQNNAVSLRFTGKTPKRSDWSKHHVVIEDPFMSRNLGESVTDFKKFIGVIRGSFTILQSGVPFVMMCKITAEIAQYDSVRGKDNDREAYIPLKRWSKSVTSKTFVLIDLPTGLEGNTYDDRIKNLFSTHGEITRIIDLDQTTKQIFFNADDNIARNIVLPATFILDGKMVHLVELFEYMVIPEKPQLQQL